MQESLDLLQASLPLNRRLYFANTTAAEVSESLFGFNSSITQTSNSTLTLQVTAIDVPDVEMPLPIGLGVLETFRASQECIDTAAAGTYRPVCDKSWPTLADLY